MRKKRPILVGLYYYQTLICILSPDILSKAMSQTMTDFLKLIKYLILSLKYGLDTSKSKHFVNFCKGVAFLVTGMTKIYK